MPSSHLILCKHMQNDWELHGFYIKCFQKFRLFNSHEQVWKMSNLKIKRLGTYCSLFWFIGAITVFWSLPKEHEAGFHPLTLVFHLAKVGAEEGAVGSEPASGPRSSLAAHERLHSRQSGWSWWELRCYGWSLLRQEVSWRIFGETRKSKHILIELCQGF